MCQVMLHVKCFHHTRRRCSLTVWWLVKGIRPAKRLAPAINQSLFVQWIYNTRKCEEQRPSALVGCSYNCPMKVWTILRMRLGKTRSSADSEKPVRRDIIRREENYRQLVGRRTAISCAEGVLTYRQAGGSCHCSAL